MAYLDLERLEPDYVLVQTEEALLHLEKKGAGVWEKDAVSVRCVEGSWRLSSPRHLVRRVLVRWRARLEMGAQVLGDHFERGYGDLEWKGLAAERILPWYFLVAEGDNNFGCGVCTNPNAICFWQVSDTDVSLCMDVRSLGRGVRLDNKELEMAQVVCCRGEGDAFATARALCNRMCTNGIVPEKPVYGGNNWYYAYGTSSQEEILQDARRIAGWANGLENRPYMVIDACWQSSVPFTFSCAGGPYWKGNAAFPDMPGLAERIRAMDVRPGIWCRPLLTTEDVPDHWVLRTLKGEGNVLDPTLESVREKIGQDIARIASWGYELIKYDFSTYDILGTWGFEMGSALTKSTRAFEDPSVTTAQAMKMLYQTIFESAGGALLIGCNTVGHLITGYAQIQRTGDDTSGVDWERTRKMGVNTLSHRMAQHGIFFAADADCVGITPQVPWEMNRKWLDVLSRSSTPLFVSADPKALTPQIENEIAQAFQRASQSQDLLIPCGWTGNTCPSVWKNAVQSFEYDWNRHDRFVFNEDDIKL